MKEELSSDDSISSFSNSGEEINSEIPQEDYASIRNEIKELNNDLKTWIKKYQHFWIWLQITLCKIKYQSLKFLQQKIMNKI